MAQTLFLTTSCRTGLVKICGSGVWEPVLEIEKDRDVLFSGCMDHRGPGNT